MFFRKTKKRLAAATAENETLSSELLKANETIDHLRHMLDLKKEECDALNARVNRMEKKVEYADTMEAHLNEIEAQVEKFAALKKSLDKKIEVLRMERDEARALNKARQNLPPPIDFIDQEALRDNKKRTVEKPIKSPGGGNRQISEVTDWYMPLPDS